jgi:hypothetical protein
MKLRTLKVWWRDAAGHEGQLDRKEAIRGLGRGLLMESAGIAIQDNKHGIILAQDYIPDEDQVRNPIFIARKMILKVKKLD